MIDKKTKEDSLLRLKKIEGQIRGLAKMVVDERYCIEIVNQINAVSHALEKVALCVMKRHIQSCVAEAIKEDKSDVKVNELMQTIYRFIK